MEAIFIPISFFGALSFIVWTSKRASVAKAQAVLDSHGRMLDKFGSAAEFVSFLQTPQGAQYLASITESPRENPFERIISSVKLGVILIMVSAPLLAVPFLIGSQNPFEEPPFIVGFIGLFLGSGFIVSAIVAHRLSRAFGLTPEPQQLAS